MPVQSTKKDFIVSAYVTSKNSEVLGKILDLYLPEKALIADVTFAKGAFWKGLDVDIYPGIYAWSLMDPYKRIVLASDLNNDPSKVSELAAWGVDCRKLPYDPCCLDGLVLDPPYAGTGSQGENGFKRPASKCIAGFGNDFLGSRSSRNILQLYYDGMDEAHRVLKPKAKMIVKTMDQVETGLQRMMHCDIYNHAISNGFIIEDLFVVVSDRAPMLRHEFQKHARKNHSYFMVFRRRA